MYDLIKIHQTLTEINKIKDPVKEGDAYKLLFKRIIVHEVELEMQEVERLRKLADKMEKLLLES